MSELMSLEEKIAKIRDLPLPHILKASANALSHLAGLAALADDPRAPTAEDAAWVRERVTAIAQITTGRLSAHLAGNYAEALRLHNEGCQLLDTFLAEVEKRMRAFLANNGVTA